MKEREPVSVGVDVGGTFTDLVAVYASGRVFATKVLSTPGDRAVGVMHAVREAEVSGELNAGQVERFVHGTTVVTNLLLERAGTRVVLLTTAGFTDLLWLRRQDRASLYDLARDHPAPLVLHEDVIAVRERVAPCWTSDGVVQGAPLGVEVVEALSEVEIQRVADAAKSSGAAAFAVSLLHAHVFPQHEMALMNALRVACPHATIACSHQVFPEIREYERTATTTAEAYARPAVTDYMRTLSAALEQCGLPQPRVMTSSGGTLSAADAVEQAASLALSGPAAGVTAAAVLCRNMGIQNALTIDIGGTSADVGLIVDGEPLIERGGVLDGVPISLPRILVETVAAGGGSIGRVDSGGALHAGPASAGANPGPACYGMGGTSATITDAHVVLSHIAEGQWSASVRIDAVKAETSVQALADVLGRSLQDTARALLATADATMARALRRVSVERGLHPRDMVLVAFGGGGPLHACGLAEQLGVERVFVPPWAGVLSALGLALAPERRDGLASVMRRCNGLSDTELQEARHSLVSSLADGRVDLVARVWARLRYLGQGHEVDVPLFGGDAVETLIARFMEVHNARSGFTLDGEVEIVGLRASLEGQWWPLNTLSLDDAHAIERILSGPCTIGLPDATLRVHSGWRARSLSTGGWLLELEPTNDVI